MTKIEFSILKVFLLISGALSLFLTWVRIWMTIDGISIAFDFNLSGQVVGISLVGLEIDASYFQGRFFIEFLFPGLLYFLGFCMCAIQVRID